MAFPPLFLHFFEGWSMIGHPYILSFFGEIFFASCILIDGISWGILDAWFVSCLLHIHS